ncbi:hypothetical protein [Bacteriovorax sp. Seq25_V]|uniref:hypothetical protein n=1 Tax=Bacteriovorax sp. Seq25_V TaxID=1201288 RepID=UPI00038A4C68|nr:hypothetical protein [Bacteriovorax sp. Seq25_V]EQC44807.1 hypothetical protein M900_0334 [Bacteriovorax sp. Seq25_V]
MRFLLVVATFIFSVSAFSQEKVIYKYKKYEEINLGEIKVEGELGAPGEITVSERYLRKFKNKLPSKPNFHFEMMRGLEKIR